MTSPKRKGSIVLNVGRCRYEIVPEAAEVLGYRIDLDVENLASTLTKTIEQPLDPKAPAAKPQQHQEKPLGGAANSVVANTPVGKSNLSAITSGLHKPVHQHDGVYTMIESRRAHIIWSDVTVTPQQLSLTAVWQRLNHFPGISATLSRKVPLAQTMMKAWKCAPEFFSNIVPLSFSLKRDAAILRQYFEEIEFSLKAKKKEKQQQQKQQKQQKQLQQGEQQQQQPSSLRINRRQSFHSNSTSSSINPFLVPTTDSSNDGDGKEENSSRIPPPPPRIFIFKPNSGCQGHDIKLTCRPLQMMNKLLTGAVAASRHFKEDDDFVCQAYIDRPLLIEKRKFDLRVYVLLLSVTPELRVLVHREGLVRLCASEYVAPKPSNVRKSTIHLTNYAVNKNKLGKECDAARSSGNNSIGNDNEEVDEENDEEEEPSAAAAASSPQQQPATLKIGGIKRDFSFLNSFLDSAFQEKGGGSAEVWGKIDRAIVLTLMAAHDQLERTYKQASATNQVLLRRAAMQYLKDEEAKKKAATTTSTTTTTAEKENIAAAVDQEDVAVVEAEDDVDEEENEEEKQQQEEQKKIDPEQFVQNCCIGRNCFELLGFDLLLTEEGLPIVMEVNHGPSLETGAAIDQRVKSQVLTDLFRHVSVLPP